jgi:hypothetical protein
MQSDSVFSVMIDRRCRVRSGTSDDEAPLQLDDDGFLDPSAAEAAFAEHLMAGALVTQQVAATARALVLLGEPGAGKSTVFARLAYDGETEDEGHPRVVEVDAADLVDREAFSALLGIHLDALPPLPAGGTSGSASAGGGSGHSDSELILIVDQLDESPILASLPAFLRGSLRVARR